ncbi:MAG: translation initiation factor, partial [Gammaproteobacteria bacterium]
MPKKPPPAPPRAASPFAVLAGIEVPSAPPTTSPDADAADRSRRARGRLDVRRMTAHRGGKTVTVITGFDGVPAAEIEQLAKRLQKACGAGGTI